MSADLLADFQEFVADMQASNAYHAWARDNHGGTGYSIDNPKTGSELQKWMVFRDQILRGTRPTPPSMVTALGKGLVDEGVMYLDATAAPPPPLVHGARSLPQGPFTDKTGAAWYRTTSGGTVSKVHVHDTPDYGVALMGYFSPAPPAPSTGVWTVTDCIGERVGHTPPTSNGTAEAGAWLGQKVNATRLLGNGTWMGAWTGCQCCDSTITDLVCATLAPAALVEMEKRNVSVAEALANGWLGKLPGVGLYVEHCTRRTVFDGLTSRSHGNGVNIEWWYQDGGYAPYVAKELPGAPSGKAGSWDLEIKNFDIQSDAAGIFVDAGGCGIHIHDGVTNAPIYLPKNLAVPSKPNVVDEASITYTGSGALVRYHSNAIG